MKIYRAIVSEDDGGFRVAAGCYDPYPDDGQTSTLPVFMTDPQVYLSNNYRIQKIHNASQLQYLHVLLPLIKQSLGFMRLLLYSLFGCITGFGYCFNFIFHFSPWYER